MNAPARITGQEYFMRVWLENEADRLARLIHWSVHTPDEARHELRVFARRQAARAKLTLDPDRIADRVLAETWHYQNDIHAATLARLAQIALRVFNRGGGPDEATAAIRHAAILADLPAPVALLEQAMHQATLEHRRNTQWRRRMEATA